MQAAEWAIKAANLPARCDSPHTLPIHCPAGYSLYELLPALGIPRQTANRVMARAYVLRHAEADALAAAMVYHIPHLRRFNEMPPDSQDAVLARVGELLRKRWYRHPTASRQPAAPADTIRLRRSLSAVCRQGVKP